jgi:hypothetical protein
MPVFPACCMSEARRKAFSGPLEPAFLISYMLLKIFVPLSIPTLILKQYASSIFPRHISRRYILRRTGIGLQICRQQKYLYNADMDAK